MEFRKYRAWLRCWTACAGVLALCASGLALCACGDDGAVDIDARGDAAAKPGSGARDASAGSSEPFVVTPSEAVGGACFVRNVAGRDRLEKCSGLDKLEACARRQCDLDNCLPLCTEYTTCLRASSVACDDTCIPAGECATCMSTIGSCIVTSTCLGTFHCAKLVDGGYCDQLRACCMLQGDWANQCGLLAEAAASVMGEDSCEMILGEVPSFRQEAVPCELGPLTPKP